MQNIRTKNSQNDQRYIHSNITHNTDITVIQLDHHRPKYSEENLPNNNRHVELRNYKVQSV